MATIRCSPHFLVLYSGLLWQAFLQETVSASCVEYEKVVNGSGFRLKTCPLDKPASHVYCCVDTCCEEPHLAILVTSVLGGLLICVIGIGLVVLCIIDLHKVTCDSRDGPESPLLTEEEDDQDILEDSIKTPHSWYKSEKTNAAMAPVETYENSSTQTIPCDHSDSLTTTTTCTYMTEVSTAAPPTPVEEIKIISEP